MASKDVNTLTTDHVARLSSLQFPMKLHVMLEESLKNGLDDIVGWWSNEGFRIYDKRRFESEIMPRYFKSTTHKSFQRTLNLWGFQTNHEGVVHHTFFRKEKPELCYEIMRIGSVKQKELDEQEHADAKLAAREPHHEPRQHLAPFSFARTLNQGGVDGNLLVEKLFSVLSNRDLQSQTPIIQLYENLLGTSMEDILAKAFLMQLQEKEVEQGQANEQASAMQHLVMQALQNPSLLPRLPHASSSSTLSSANLAAVRVPPTHSPPVKNGDETEDFIQAAAARLARAQSGNLDEAEAKPVQLTKVSSVHTASARSYGSLSQNDVKRNAPLHQYQQQNAHFVISPPPSMQDLRAFLLSSRRNANIDGSRSVSQGLSLASQISSSLPTVAKRRKIANELVPVSGLGEWAPLSRNSQPPAAEAPGHPDDEGLQSWCPSKKRRRHERPRHVVTQDNLRVASNQGARVPGRETMAALNRTNATRAPSQRPPLGAPPHLPPAQGSVSSAKNSLISLAWKDAQHNRTPGREHKRTTENDR